MDNNQAQILTAVVGLFGTLIVAILSAIYNSMTLKHLKHEEEKKDIRRQLNEFYGPYQQRLETSKQLHDKLNKGKPDDFRVLTFFLNGNQFNGNDKVLYEEIRKITDELETLRMERGGLVDEPDLQNLLAKAGAHFRIISMAHDGKLSGEIERFDDYVYPRELNNKISEKIKLLQTQLKE
jgi:hypothetical protein